MQTPTIPDENIAELISPFNREDLGNALHPSLFDDNPEYDMLVLRLPTLGDPMDIHSYGFILTENRSYYFNKATKQFEMLGRRFEGPHRYVDPIIDRLLKGVVALQDHIADMEEALYEDRTGSTFMTDWFSLKRDLVRIERLMKRATDVLEDAMAYYTHATAFPIDHYTDLHEHCERIARMATLLLSKLDYIYNFYNVRTNEHMNRLISVLTVISGVFLPLNLLVGFFGMNTGGLPFAQSAYGTVMAIGLMGSMALLTSAVVLLWYRHSKQG